MERALERMEKEGIFEPVELSEWATPLVFVPKADGTVRGCGDYKVTVNPALHVDQHPILTLEQAFGGLAHGQRFTKIDLKSAYQQLVIEEASRELVTINIPKELFRYTRLPFGIASSPAIWQRFIDQVTAGLEMTCTIMDDVLISGRIDKEHYRNLDALFQRFQKYGLLVKPPKCFYCQESVVYMGRQLSKEGMRPTGERLKAIVDAPAPQDVRALRSWLGMVNFQRRLLQICRRWHIL